MDRRDALKKLGMGGATIAGASMVVSSPAFAASTPTIGDTLAVTKAGTANPTNAAKRMRFFVIPGSATCSGTPLGPAVMSTTILMSNASPPTMSINPQGSFGTPFTIGSGDLDGQGRYAIYAQNNDRDMDTGDSFDLTVTTTWTCDDGSGPQTSPPQTFSATALWSGGLFINGGDWTFT